MAATRWSLSLVVAAGLFLAGCDVAPPPNPNDPKFNRQLTRVDTLSDAVAWMAREIEERKSRNAITDEQGREALAEYTQGLLEEITLDDVKPETAHKYGDLFKVAERWEDAQRALTIAIEHAEQTKNEDRRVNDTLRLAYVLASQDKVPEAIKTARTVFDVKDEAAAPILPATLYEIVPAGKGKGNDAELAKLLEEAISHHRRTLVDPKTDAGKAFLSARWHHVKIAWQTVIELYASAGEADAARESAEKADKMMRSQARV